MTSKTSASCEFTVIFSVIIGIASLLIWAMVYIDQDPAPQVTLLNLSASNFQISNSGLVAEWEAEILIFKYITPDLGLYSLPYTWKYPVYDSVQAFIKYKEHVLAVNSTRLKPTWGVLGLDTVIVKFSTRGLECKDFVFHEIKKDRDAGAVTFGMEVFLWNDQRCTKPLWAQCTNLRVDFNQANWVVSSAERCNVTRRMWQ
ncbi:hypothetical protein SO802_030925 [Lithocarpus litseifolius]|uniref:Late embryogenesis abundant protein LEA-2 subgroup domain-containing protein n=1 Tax=Lithocarpus litseifolius TaxID=425828 RepID=A0AAW2BIZ0_9ROSI